jgi:hypothetical protein
VDHEKLQQKLSCFGLSDNTVFWFQSYLGNRLNATVIENKRSSLMEMQVGVPQGSILGPLLFIIYMNDLPRCLEFYNVILYADDTVIYYSSTMIQEVESKLNTDLVNITDWFNSNLLTLNFEKSSFLLICGSRKLKLCGEVKLVVQGKQFKQAATTKYLGIKIHENMTWSDHIRDICSKINRRIGILKQVRHILPRQELVTLYNSIVLPLMDYGDLIWGDKNNKLLMEDLHIMQNKAAKVILGLPIMYSATEAIHNLQWTPLLERRRRHRCVSVYKCLNDLMEVEYNMITNNMVHSYLTRGKNNLHLPKVKREWESDVLLSMQRKNGTN